MLGYGIAKTRSSWKSEAIWTAFVFGALCTIAVGAFELIVQAAISRAHLSAIADAAVTAVIMAAIPEESAKFLVLVGLAEKHVDVRRRQDYIMQALAVSLGFAALENAFFVIAAGDWKVIAAARAITAVPAHGICGLVMGALLVAARLSRKKITAALALIVPVILHAAYDFPLLAIDKNVAREFFAGIWLLILILSSVFAILLSNRMGRKAGERMLHRDAIGFRTTRRRRSSGAGFWHCSLAPPLPSRVTISMVVKLRRPPPPPASSHLRLALMRS